jgi:hypothetical protein
MGIFVTDKLFDIQFYIEEIIIDNIVVSIKTSDKQTSKSILCKCKGRDFETMSKILEDSTILNSINGNPMLRTNIFYKMILRNFIKEMYLNEDDEQTKINLTSDSINSLNYNIVKTIAKKWMNITGG